jgi:hypothetical protein
MADGKGGAGANGSLRRGAAQADARPEGLARRKEHSFNSECKIPNAEFEMARPQAVARRNGGRLQRLAHRKVRVWGMARIPALKC